jgi:hypothetical protein
MQNYTKHEQPYLQGSQYYTPMAALSDNKKDDYFQRSSVINMSSYSSNNTSNNSKKYADLKHKRSYWPISMIHDQRSMTKSTSFYLKSPSKHVRFADAPNLESIVYIDSCKQTGYESSSFLDDIKYSDFYI